MKIRSVIGVLLVALLTLGCLGGDSVPEKTTSTIEIVDADTAFEEYLIKYKQRKQFEGTSRPERSHYGISDRVFEELPPLPDDFLYTVYLIKTGKFFDIEGLGPEYYKQPEFDPEFTRQGLKHWTQWNNPNFVKKYWTTSGVRTYPYNQYLAASPGYSFNVTVFLSSDWSVETYQGIRIKPKWIVNATTQEGDYVEGMSNANRYVNVNVTPEEFILTPAYPQFTKEWVKKLKFTGKISDDAPEGVYILSMDILPPTGANSDVWSLEYMNLYSEGAELVKIDRPYLQAFINVKAEEET